jgi:hypothetical protein
MTAGSTPVLLRIGLVLTRLRQANSGIHRLEIKFQNQVVKDVVTEHYSSHHVSPRIDHSTE